MRKRKKEQGTNRKFVDGFVASVSFAKSTFSRTLARKKAARRRERERESIEKG